MKMLSTSALAKQREIDSRELFAQLKDKGWMYKKDGDWHLTKEGRIAGGDTKYNPKFGEYVVWPSNLDLNKRVNSAQTISATKIGEKLNVSNRKVNNYFKDLGWQERDQGGWVITKEGRKNGGHQLEASYGTPYCVWDEAVLENPLFKRTIAIGEGNFVQEETAFEKEYDDFRKKFPAEKRTADGHYVRSRAELLIDNFLYYNGIAHAYEKKVNIEEDMYCDFYIPEKKIYIEFWGMEENEQYLERKNKKKELYAKYSFTLIELNDRDLDNLEEILEAKLRRLNVNVN